MYDYCTILYKVQTICEPFSKPLFSLLSFCVGFYCGYWCVHGLTLKAEAAATVLCLYSFLFDEKALLRLLCYYFASFNCVRVLLAISRLLSSPHAVVKSRGFIFHRRVDRHTLEAAARLSVNAARSALCSFWEHKRDLSSNRFLRFYASISRSNPYILHAPKLFTL